MEKRYRVGAATSDGIVVNRHFGRANCFQIIDINGEEEPRFVEKRFVTPICGNGNHEEEKLFEQIKGLADCQYLLVGKIGPQAASALEENGIFVYELPGLIEESVKKLLNYIEIQEMLQG